MKNDIYKFRHDMLENGAIHVQKKRGDTSFAAHRHEYYEIILYRRCNGRCIVNGTPYLLSDCCLFLLTPRDYHKIEAKNPSDATSVIISFSENFVDPELLARLAFSARVWYCPSDETVRCAESLYLDYTNGSEMRKKKLFHSLNAILCDVLEYGSEVSGQNACVSPYIAKAVTLILSDMSVNRTVEELSAICGFNPSYFSTLFHREMGQSFKKWLNGIRTEHAKSLLTETTKPILDICYECGYRTPSQFIKIFKRNTGLSPSEYRKAPEQ